MTILFLARYCLTCWPAPCVYPWRTNLWFHPKVISAETSIFRPWNLDHDWKVWRSFGRGMTAQSMLRQSWTWGRRFKIICFSSCRRHDYAECLRLFFYVWSQMQHHRQLCKSQSYGTALVNCIFYKVLVILWHFHKKWKGRPWLRVSDWVSSGTSSSLHCFLQLSLFNRCVTSINHPENIHERTVQH